MKRSVKWVKRAGQWCVTTHEMDKKKGRVLPRQAWYDTLEQIPPDES